MSNPVREKWDQRYQQMAGSDTPPASILPHYRQLIPSAGRALELACGLGANALYLASLGLEVDAWDISTVAIEKLEQAAVGQGLVVHTRVCDLLEVRLETNHYDLIIVSRFLQRELCPAMAAALKPGGVLFYQTFTTRRDKGPSNPDFLLQPGELPSLFAGLEVLVYQEGEEDTLVARKGA
ncbi:MAG: methyltransferase domain-containing protein [Chromatiales bacterium]|nr:methyltransferase domain-containing protein [Chromatiales bacterium]